MQITPRYDGAPIIQLDGPPAAVCVPLVRQRRRLGTLVGELTLDQWAAASRCEGWRVQDVIAHLTTTDEFWLFALTSGVAGAPTRILSSFDPVATPAALVDTTRDRSPEETSTAYLAASEALSDAFEALDAAGWTALAEAPPGHVRADAVAHHALWDSWVHERDVLQPLGLDQVIEPDEVLACIRYAAALAPAFVVQGEPRREGGLVLDVVDPEARIVVDVGRGVVRVRDGGEVPKGALERRGRAVDVLEALSVRAPWPDVQPPPDQAWLLKGLADAFGA